MLQEKVGRFVYIGLVLNYYVYKVNTISVYL